jgi:hypothetical protein
MKIYKQLITLICILFFTGYIGNAQNKINKSVYNIRAMGMDVGTISVKQESHNGKIKVEAISEVEVRIVFKIKMKYIQTCTYVNGVLQESLLEMYKKGEVDSTTRLTKKGNGYVLNKDGEVSYVSDIIRFSGSLLWYHEPKVGVPMYFEISGEKTAVEELKPHEYLITDPHNGNKNEYFYKNNMLKEAVIKHTMANVYLTLKEETAQVITSSN